MIHTLFNYPSNKNLPDKKINYDFLGYPNYTLNKYIGPNASTGSIINPGTNNLYLAPVYIHQTQRFDRIACRTNGTSATAIARMGIYKCSKNSLPSNLVLNAGVTGALAVNFTTYNIAIDIVLNPGMYYLAIVLQNATINMSSFVHVPIAGYSKMQSSDVTNSGNVLMVSNVSGQLFCLDNNTSFTYRNNTPSIGLRIKQ